MDTYELTAGGLIHHIQKKRPNLCRPLRLLFTCHSFLSVIKAIIPQRQELKGSYCTVTLHAGQQNYCMFPVLVPIYCVGILRTLDAILGAKCDA